MGCLRITMIILNIILFFYGMILAVVGAYIIYKINEIGLHNPIITVFYSVFGVLICGVTGFGVFLRESKNRKLLFIYAFSLLLVALLQVPVCSTTFDIGAKLHKTWKDDLEESFNLYYKDSFHRNRFNYIQYWYECCGFTSYLDYEGRNLPRSCCIEHYNQTHKCNTPEGFHETGCSVAVWFYFNIMMFGTLFFALCFCILEIITAGIAFYQFLKPPQTEEEKAAPKAAAAARDVEKEKDAEAKPKEKKKKKAKK